MQNIWRKTLELLRQYPILALPILIADVFQWAVLWIRKPVIREIAYYLAQGPRSVLGGPPQISNDPSVATKVALAIAPLTTGMYFLTTCIFMIGMLTTSQFVQATRSNKIFDIKTAAVKVWKSQKRTVFVVSAMILVSLAVGTAFFSFVAIYIANSRTSFYMELGYGYGVLISIATAYLVTPSILSALIAEQPVNPGDLKLARLTVILGVSVSDLIGLVAPRIESYVLSLSNYPSGITQLFDLAGSLLTAFPYVLTSIALTLIAVGPQRYEEISELSVIL